jgi:hypothetical protein
MHEFEYLSFLCFSKALMAPQVLVYIYLSLLTHLLKLKRRLSYGQLDYVQVDRVYELVNHLLGFSCIVQIKVYSTGQQNLYSLLIPHRQS